MRRHPWFTLFTLILISCNVPVTDSTVTPPSTLTAVPTSSSTSTPTVVPIETLQAVDTPTIAPSPTSSITLAAPKTQPVNCRYGPAVTYSIVGALILGRQAEVVGKSIDETWWYVKNPSDPSTNCWLSADFVTVDGNVAGLPVVGPPDIGVDRIQVQVDPVLMNVGCNSFPQTVDVKAQIVANGPTLVTWRWETSAGDVSPEVTLLFDSEGQKEVQTVLTVWNANDYWVKLHVLKPNDKNDSAIFKVTCVP